MGYKGFLLWTESESILCVKKNVCTDIWVAKERHCGWDGSVLVFYCSVTDCQCSLRQQAFIVLQFYRPEEVQHVSLG